MRTSSPWWCAGKEELSPKEQKLVVTFLVSQAERIASSNAAKKSSDIREVASSEPPLVFGCHGRPQVPALRPWMSLATKALQPSRKVGHLRQLTRANALVRRGLWRLAGLDVEEEEDDDAGYTSTESKEGSSGGGEGTAVCFGMIELIRYT